MIWFYALTTAVVLLSLILYSRRRRVQTSGTKTQGRHGKMEVATEIGVPPLAVDPEEALQSDRLAGVERPKVGGSQAMGALKHRNLRKDNLSKEVEVAWEAGETIEFQPGAYAWPRDFIDKTRLPRGGDAKNSPRNPKSFHEENYFLPERYGVDRLVLMARDPQWIYAYWEITHEKYKDLVAKRLAEWGISKPALRLYDVTHGLPPDGHLDVLVGENSDNWYVHVDRPQHTLVAEIGRLFEGEFVPFLRSNPVTLPPRTFSMEIAQEFRPEWEKLYGRFTPEGYASSPMLWRK